MADRMSRKTGKESDNMCQVQGVCKRKDHVEISLQILIGE